jgi:NADH-quinone oxidoreductase subunit J
LNPDPKNLIIAGSALAAVALWAAMAQRALPVRLLGSALAAIGLLGVISALDGPGGDVTQRALFWLFAAGAIGGGVLMITGRDPVHGALWFAVTTLCVCGLFLLLSAPFLAAATIIVYAGAIIVTFMFVIMLAQQGGVTSYDQRLRLPLPGSLASFFVLGALAFTLLDWQTRHAAAAGAAVQGPALVAADSADDVGQPLPTNVTPAEMYQLQTLGKTLFVDYLFTVELGGTLLLLATIGAIALAPRRQRGNL